MVNLNPGGYVMVDFEGFDLLSQSSVTIDGIFNSLNSAIDSGKLVVVSGLLYNDEPISPAAVSFKELDGALTGSVGTYMLSVSSEDAVTVSDFTGMTPASPSTLSGEATEAGVVLTWSIAPGARNYRLSRRPAGGSTYTVLSVNILENTFTDTSELSAGSYVYAVSAQNAYGISGAKSATITVE